MNNDPANLAIILVCTLALGAPATAAQSAVGAPQQLAAVPLTSADLEFLLAAASYASAGNAAAELALSRSDAPRIRSLARGMLEDHRSAAARLSELARTYGVALPRGTTSEQGLVLGGLRGLRGEAFERDFIRRAAINENRELIAILHRQATASGRDPALARFAASMLRKLQGHLAVAQWLDERLSAAESGAARPGG